LSRGGVKISEKDGDGDLRVWWRGWRGWGGVGWKRNVKIVEDNA